MHPLSKEFLVFFSSDRLIEGLICLGCNWNSSGKSRRAADLKDHPYPSYTYPDKRLPVWRPQLNVPNQCDVT